MDKVDCIVIGAGVVGLAVARAMALRGREVLVLETHSAIGMETSSRNSEVIHAGIYYASGSLKAKLCVAGREALYAYCSERGIPHRRCGKLIVATTDAQCDLLEQIRQQGIANGCAELVALSADDARALEPALACVAALYSPATGIIDSHAYMLSLQGDAEQAGALFAFGSRVLSGRTTKAGIELQVRSIDGVDISLLASAVVNCAGLWAPQLARRITGLDPASIPHAYFAKGNYFGLAAGNSRHPFSHLIYPVPEPGGLGVHLTLDLAGQARFGPDVEWLDTEAGEIGESFMPDYRADPARANAFYSAIRAYWPGLPDGALQPAYAGIRPKIHAEDSPLAAATDFLLDSHGEPRYLGLYGIESPGLTASLAIAAQVAAHFT